MTTNNASSVPAEPSSWKRGELLLAVFGLLTAIFSGYTAWLAHNISKEGVKISESGLEISRQAQAFSDRLFKIQQGLEKPSISIASGHLRLKPGKENSTNSSPLYVLDLSVRNSGGRDAKPLFVAVAQHRAFTSMTPVVGEVTNLGKGDNVTLKFDIGSITDVSDWYVAYGFVDVVATGNASAGASEADMTTSCSDVQVVKLPSLQDESTSNKLAQVFYAGTTPTIGDLRRDLESMNSKSDRASLAMFTYADEEVAKAIKTRLSSFCTKS